MSAFTPVVVEYGPDGYPTSTTCVVCDHRGHTNPIPAKGKQGLWEWSP